jgi:hypothetical protein
MSTRNLPQGLLAPLALTLGWTPYLPIGLQYLALLTGAVLALSSLAQQQRLGELARQPVLRAAAALWLWLALSALWSPAPAHAIISHLWMYALPLLVAPLVLALPPRAAKQALLHFVVASTGVAIAEWLAMSGLLPGRVGTRPIVDVWGNQRIAFSLQLALACALAAHAALTATSSRKRMLAGLAALICLAGLAAQDRRTGMLGAPLLLAVLALLHPRNPWRRAALLCTIVLATLAIGLASPNVRQRFDEGAAELQAYRADAEVSTSWGMRARMLEITALLIREHPLFGHGVGSWVSRWRAQVDGQPTLLAHTTPHSEYLLLAMQGGAVALALAALAWALALRAIHRRGSAAVPALLVLVAITWAGFFNVVLRDAKFALALLGLFALAWAGSRADAPGHAP